MNLFSAIMDKIFSHPSAPARAAAPAATPAPAPATSQVASAPAPQAAQAQPIAAPPSPPVDVEAVLTQMASTKGGGGDWRRSIVDLLKLLDLDSSLAARKQLAQELNVHVGADGSAEENVALHKAVMQKLADNGGQVPDDLKG